MDLFPHRIRFLDGFGCAVKQAVFFKGKIIAFAEGSGYPHVKGFPVVYHNYLRFFDPCVVGDVLLVQQGRYLMRSEDGVNLDIVYDLEDRVVQLGWVENIAYVVLSKGCIMTTKNGRTWQMGGDHNDVCYETPAEVKIWKNLLVCRVSSAVLWKNGRSNGQFCTWHSFFRVYRDVAYLTEDAFLHCWKNGCRATFRATDIIRGIYASDHGLIVVTLNVTYIFDPETEKFSTTLLPRSTFITLVNGDTHDIMTRARVLVHKSWNFVDYEFYSPYRKNRTRSLLSACLRVGICFGLFREIIGLV